MQSLDELSWASIIRFDFYTDIREAVSVEYGVLLKSEIHLRCPKLINMLQN